MSNIKNVYIKAPKKTVNNKNIKMIIKNNSLKKIDEIQNDKIDNNKIKKDDFKNNISDNLKLHKQNSIDNIKNKNISDYFKLNKKSFTENNTKMNQSRLISSSLNKKSFSRNKTNIKRLNIRKKDSKKKEKYVRLLIDSNIDVQNRMETKKKFQNKLMKLTKKELKKVLIKKGLIKKNSMAPTKLLTDIYLNSKLLGDINVIKQN